MNVYDCGLYLQTAAGTRRILKTGKLFVKEAQWSPDGKRIAYVIGSSTGTELRVVGADGRGDRLVLKETGELYIGFSSTDWSWIRDSRHIVLVAGSSHMFLKIDANATNAYRALMTPLRGMYAIEVDASPVSDLLAVVYFNTEAQERGIALIALDDNGSNLGIREFKRVRTLPWDADDNYASLGWAPDGRRLAFVHSIVDKSIGKGTARVEVVAALPDAPTPTPLTEYPKGTRDGAAYVEIARYSPDGKWIAFKTIRDMTATWEAIHPDGTERSPFAARLGEIDWQPCSSNCETLNPGKSQLSEADVKTTGLGRAPWLPALLYPLAGVVEFEVKNVGTKIAAKVTVSGGIGGGELLGAEGGRCTVSGNGFTCRIEKLGPKATTRIGLAVAPSRAGDSVLSGSAEASTTTEESNKKNNKGRFVVPVIPNVSAGIANGCGRAGSPELVTRVVSAYGVRRACDFHDECYGGRVGGLLQPEIRWRTRIFCDEQMRSDGKDGCLTIKRALKPGAVASCLFNINAFHIAVRKFGRGAFLNARKSACAELYPSASRRSACYERAKEQA